jgi:hypothetical protein
MCGVVKKYVADYPSLTTAACLILPAIGWFVHTKVSPHLQIHVGAIDHGLVGEVYLGLAGVAAICGGFAGVIIVFGLTPSSDLFRKFRLDAGERMVANWISVITNSFLAAAVGIVAGTLESLTFHAIGAFVFVAGGLLLAHSSIRSIWILHKLLTLVRNDDAKTQQESYGGFQP